MIPPFDEHGYLPPGIHLATLEEVAQRFGAESEVRRAEMQSVRWLVDLARRAGILRLVINGSFVTDAFEPNDVDCVLLMGPIYSPNAGPAEELSEGLPFIKCTLWSRPTSSSLSRTCMRRIARRFPKGWSRCGYEH